MILKDFIKNTDVNKEIDLLFFSDKDDFLECLIFQNKRNIPNDALEREVMEVYNDEENKFVEVWLR